MKKNLTVRFIQSIRPPKEGVAVYWDTAISSFGLHVSRSGKMTWKLMYRVNGRLKNKKIGTYPMVSLADARHEANQILLEASEGEDRFADTSTAVENPSFDWIAKEYLEKHAKPIKRQWRTDERIIDNELLPYWGHAKADEISRRDVIELLDGLVERGAPIQANRVHALISMIFNWAMDRGHLQNNPCHKLKKPSQENRRDRVLSEEDIRKLWTAFEQQGIYISAIFKLMLLTAQRRWEISHMRLADIDLKNGWWTIPGEIAKNGLSHRVPLVAATQDVIKGLPDPTVDQVWVFPSPTRKGQHIASVQKAAQRVQNESGVDDFVLHDLRRTASSIMASIGVSNYVIGRILNHVETGVTAVYNRYSYDAEKRDALERWEKKLLEIVGTPVDQTKPEPKPSDPHGILTADQYAMLAGIQKMQRKDCGGDGKSKPARTENDGRTGAGP